MNQPANRSRVVPVLALVAACFTPSLRESKADDGDPSIGEPVKIGELDPGVATEKFLAQSEWETMAGATIVEHPYIYHAMKAILDQGDGWASYQDPNDHTRGKIRDIVIEGAELEFNAVNAKGIDASTVVKDAIDTGVELSSAPSGVGAALVAGSMAIRSGKYIEFLKEGGENDPRQRAIRHARENPNMQLPEDAALVRSTLKNFFVRMREGKQDKALTAVFGGVLPHLPSAKAEAIVARYPWIPSVQKFEENRAEVADLKQRVTKTERALTNLYKGASVSAEGLLLREKELRRARAQAVANLSAKLEGLSPELAEKLADLKASGEKNKELLEAAEDGKLADFLAKESAADQFRNHQNATRSFQGYANGLASVLSVIDPKASQVVNKLADLGVAMANLANPMLRKIDPMMFTNFVSAAMGLISLLASSGPDPQQMMLEKLDKIQDTLNDMRREMKDGFKRVEGMLRGISAQITSLSSQVTALSESMTILQQRTDELRRVAIRTANAVQLTELSIWEIRRIELVQKREMLVEELSDKDPSTSRNELLRYARLHTSTGFLTGRNLTDALDRLGQGSRALQQLSLRHVSEVPALAIYCLYGSIPEELKSVASQKEFAKAVQALLDHPKSPLTREEAEEFLRLAKEIQNSVSSLDRREVAQNALAIYIKAANSLLETLRLECRNPLAQTELKFPSGMVPTKHMNQFIGRVFTTDVISNNSPGIVAPVRRNIDDPILGVPADRSSIEATKALADFWSIRRPEAPYKPVHFRFHRNLASNAPEAFDNASGYLDEKVQPSNEEKYALRLGWNAARMLPSFEVAYRFAALGKSQDQFVKTAPRFVTANPEGYIKPVDLTEDGQNDNRKITLPILPDNLPSGVGVERDAPGNVREYLEYFVRPIRAVPEYVVELKSPISGNSIARIQYRPNDRKYFYTHLEATRPLPERYWPDKGKTGETLRNLWKDNTSHHQAAAARWSDEEAKNKDYHPYCEPGGKGANGHRFNEFAAEGWVKSGHRDDFDLLSAAMLEALQKSKEFQERYAKSDVRPVTYEAVILDSKQGKILVYDSSNRKAVAMEVPFSLPEKLTPEASTREERHQFRLRIDEIEVDNPKAYTEYLDEINEEIVGWLRNRVMGQDSQGSAVYDQLSRFEGAKRLLDGFVREFAYERFITPEAGTAQSAVDGTLGMKDVLDTLYRAAEGFTKYPAMEQELTARLKAQSEKWKTAIKTAYEKQGVSAGSKELNQIIRRLEEYIKTSK